MSLILLLSAGASAADEAQLEVRPGNCVSLRQGLVCYQRIRLSWRAPSAGDYCLLADDNGAPIKCWSNARSGDALYSLEAKTDQQFHLALRDNATPLASASVTVSWVYKSKSRRRRSWRLF